MKDIRENEKKTKATRISLALLSKNSDYASNTWANSPAGSW